MSNRQPSKFPNGFPLSESDFAATDSTILQKLRFSIANPSMMLADLLDDGDYVYPQGWYMPHAALPLVLDHLRYSCYMGNKYYEFYGSELGPHLSRTTSDIFQLSSDGAQDKLVIRYRELRNGTQPKRTPFAPLHSVMLTRCFIEDSINQMLRYSKNKFEVQRYLDSLTASSSCRHDKPTDKSLSLSTRLSDVFDVLQSFVGEFTSHVHMVVFDDLHSVEIRRYEDYRVEMIRQWLQSFPEN